MIANRFKNDGKAVLKLNELQLQACRKVASKIAEGIYKFETVRCPVCNGFDFQALSEKDRYGLYMPVAVCRACGLIQTNPRMDQASYDLFYKTEYRKLYGGVEHPTDQFLRNQQRHGRAIRSFVARSCGWSNYLGKTVVEIGCGAGGILQPFHRIGAAVTGYDLGEEYLTFGRERMGLDLQAGGLNDVSKPESVDLLIYSHVLEHILDLGNELEDMRRVLRKDGVVYIELPSVRNLTKSYEMDFLKLMQNAHTYHFTLRTLDNLMQRSGFRRIEGNDVLQSVYQKQSTFSNTTQYVSDFPGVVRYLRRVEQCRRWLPFVPYKAKANLSMRWRRIMLRVKRADFIWRQWCSRLYPAM